MGDPERPEAARPEQEEVNIAAASSPAPQSRLASRLRVAAGTCKAQERCGKFYSLPSETRCRPGFESSLRTGFIFSSSREAVPGEG